LNSFENKGETILLKYKKSLLQLKISRHQSASTFLVFSDITKIRELESYTSKVKNHYLASIAHELRTPLNSIIPMAEALKQQRLDN